ncbi:MAG: hypothetical protein EON60_02380 [Alphaproteobacteria bacterium]|nr:MAG: hypothetical protein EON60_02380 [Alphaproteobacteria bacterium]
MIRSTYRNLMLLMLLLSFGVSFYLFRKTQDVQLEIGSFQNDIIRLRQELENAQSLNVALNELDNLTITEQTATQLDILRHLGLEQSNLNFTVESRDEQVIGDTRLFIHNVRIGGNMPYETALNLSDKLQSTKKIVLDAIELTVLPGDANNFINFTLAGKIYGLEKNLEALAQAAAALPEDESTPAPEIPAQPAEDTLNPVTGGASPTTVLPDISPSAAIPNQETVQ